MCLVGATGVVDESSGCAHAQSRCTHKCVQSQSAETARAESPEAVCLRPRPRVPGQTQGPDSTTPRLECRRWITRRPADRNRSIPRGACGGRTVTAPRISWCSVFGLCVVTAARTVAPLRGVGPISALRRCSMAGAPYSPLSTCRGPRPRAASVPGDRVHPAQSWNGFC